MVKFTTTAFSSTHLVEYDPSIHKSTPAPDPFVLEADYRKAVVLEKVIDAHTLLAIEIEERTPDDKPKLGRKIVLNIPKSGTGFAEFVVGREYMVIGKIISQKPFTVLVPQGDYLRPLINEGF